MQSTAQEPVDIWEIGEKKLVENATLIEDKTEKNISQNSIYKMQSQKEGRIKYRGDSNLNFKRNKVSRNL